MTTTDAEDDALLTDIEAALTRAGWTPDTKRADFVDALAGRVKTADKVCTAAVLFRNTLMAYKDGSSIRADEHATAHTAMLARLTEWEFLNVRK